MARNKLTICILAGIALGLLAGYVCNVSAPDIGAARGIAGYFSILTEIFLRLIKMIIGPLVFATLVSGITGMGDSRAVGRIGARALAWFICASLVSLSLGLLLVNLLQPGRAMNLVVPAGAASLPSVPSLTLKDFASHVVPRSFFEAMAQNEILQIVVFSVFFGFALNAFKNDGAKTIVRFVGELARVMLRVTDYVMWFAPFGAFGAIASVVTLQGLGVLVTYGKFIGGFYLALAVLWLVLTLGGYIFLRGRVLTLVKMMQGPMLLAFSTASSEAAYPLTLEKLKEFGTNSKISSFLLPLGYSFNLDGSMMYMAFSIVFIAQAYNIDLSFATQLTILLVLMVSSKGVAGVARASLVVIAATLPMFDLPESGLLLILGIDQLLDMGRSATNVIGNSIATAVVAKWEGTLRPAKSSWRE